MYKLYSLYHHLSYFTPRRKKGGIHENWLHFLSLDEILKNYHSNESYSTALSSVLFDQRDFKNAQSNLVLCTTGSERHQLPGLEPQLNYQTFWSNIVFVTQTIRC